MLDLARLDVGALLGGAGAVSRMPVVGRAGRGLSRTCGRAEPVSLSAGRLLDSPWLEAIEGNRRYLHALEPDRLLHNFRASAGLEPKGAVYGGWESDTIAGPSLGHYLTALSLMHAQTNAHPGDFFEIDYPVPAELTRGKDRVLVRFQPANDTTRCGPVFGIRIFTPAPAQGTV